MRFEMNNIHTIFESAKSKNCEPSKHADETGAKIDTTLGDSDLIKLFDNICPICGDVFASMKDAAADPKNLKLTMVKTEDLGEATQVYIEAVEFATFCEAADMNVGEAAEEILDTCKAMVPGCNDSELHVVFPSDCLNKGELGSTRFGCDVRNDWAMQLLTGCRRYGIHVNSGVEDGEPVTESAYKKAMNEAASKKPLGYEACIKRDKALIEREVNAASKEVYKTFKDNISSHYEKYMDKFYEKNKTAPKFDGMTHETDLYAIELNTNAYVDICLFYQDRVCKLLNKSEKLKALGYKFETEDYPGIFIRNAAAQAIKESAEDVNDEEGIDEAAGSSNILKIDINGKSRSVYFRDKYKDPDERKKIESNVISDVKVIIKNEEKIKKKIYNFILNDEGHDGHADEDAKSNAGYLDYFEVVESGRGYAINATMDKYQYMITNLKNGKVTPSTEITYLD